MRRPQGRRWTFAVRSVSYNLGLVRGFTNLGVVASLLLSFAQAPVQHTHGSDPDHAHAKGFIHAHWTGNSAKRPVWDVDNHDSDARMTEWFAGDGSTPAKFVVALSETIVQPILRARVSRIPPLTPHNHDPPRRLKLIPRGPPA
jgi:hypothetical protein